MATSGADRCWPTTCPPTSPTPTPLRSLQWKNTGNNQQIVVSDDVSGMTADALNRRFLTVGYKKRTHEGLSSPRFGRPFMGQTAAAATPQCSQS